MNLSVSINLRCQSKYNIAKAELGVLKARKNLENVQNERSVAMLVGGLWTWVSDSDNVISAMEDPASAETELADAQSDASFNADTANWEGYISPTDNQIGARLTNLYIRWTI